MIQDDDECTSWLKILKISNCLHRKLFINQKLLEKSTMANGLPWFTYWIWWFLIAMLKGLRVCEATTKSNGLPWGKPAFTPFKVIKASAKCGYVPGCTGYLPISRQTQAQSRVLRTRSTNMSHTVQDTVQTMMNMINHLTKCSWVVSYVCKNWISHKIPSTLHSMRIRRWPSVRRIIYEASAKPMNSSTHWFWKWTWWVPKMRVPSNHPL